MIQKSNGGFGYATTDLAAARYRANEIKADRIVYVTDVGQELHFKQIFEAAKNKCGFVDAKKTQMDHMMFGMVLQETKEIDEETGKETITVGKIKTRAGKSTKLSELLDEARDRALKTFKERKAGKAPAEGEPVEEEQKEGEAHQTKVQIESDEEMEKAAEILGISAVKYYDLSRDRTQNYTFSFDAMLDPQGNTGVYLIYAYVRICSILRKAGYDEATSKMEDFKFEISHPTEREVAKSLLKLPESIEEASKTLNINRLTTQLYEISKKVSDQYH